MQVSNNYAVINRWLKDIIDFDNGKIVFLTIRYYNEVKSEEFLKEEVRWIMRVLNRRVLGRHWIKNSLRFFIVIEKGRYDMYHTHIILNIRDISLEMFDKKLKDIQDIIRYNSFFGCKKIDSFPTHIRRRMYAREIFAKEVYSDKLIIYLMKELDFKGKKVDFSRLVTCNEIYH
ncbi:MAG: hypothetical protein N4A44_04660 [Alphaproteobacteria bacterium]|jgi:hypothetical protein|nr:hypothetical protein [Alphaproteobacteria bacterium]